MLTSLPISVTWGWNGKGTNRQHSTARLYPVLHRVRTTNSGQSLLRGSSSPRSQAGQVHEYWRLQLEMPWSKPGIFFMLSRCPNMAVFLTSSTKLFMVALLLAQEEASSLSHLRKCIFQRNSKYKLNYLRSFAQAWINAVIDPDLIQDYVRKQQIFQSSENHFI